MKTTMPIKEQYRRIYRTIRDDAYKLSESLCCDETNEGCEHCGEVMYEINKLLVYSDEFEMYFKKRGWELL
jgi:hypothetical protein